MGKLDDDGYLSFEGRRSDVIKLADGQKIMPLKLETDLRAAPLTKYCLLLTNFQKLLTSFFFLSLPRYAITVGEDKENAGVLLILDSGVVKRLAKKKGCSPKRMLNNAEILNQIKQHVETVSKAHNIKVGRDDSSTFFLILIFFSSPSPNNLNSGSPIFYRAKELVC